MMIKRIGILCRAVAFGYGAATLAETIERDVQHHPLQTRPHRRGFCAGYSSSSRSDEAAF